MKGIFLENRFYARKLIPFLRRNWGGAVQFDLPGDTRVQFYEGEEHQDGENRKYFDKWSPKMQTDIFLEPPKNHLRYS